MNRGTRPVGPGKINRSITLPEFADRLVDAMARKWQTFANPLLRRWLALGAEADGHPQAIEFRRAVGIPSIFELQSPAQKAEKMEESLEQAFRRMDAPENFESYLREFQESNQAA